MTDLESELVIIGGGPAGITAGIYAARARVKTHLIEKGVLGGQINYTERIENYPGFQGGISSRDLCRNFEHNVNELGLPVVTAEVKGISLKGTEIIIRLDEQVITSRALVIATGATPNTLGVEGEKRLVGRGVSYCAICDGLLFRKMDVAIVGGGDKALEEALYLSKIAGRVFLIHRRDQFRGTRILQEKVLAEENIHLLWNTVVEKIEGDRSVDSLLLKNTLTNEKLDLPVNGVFIFVGIHPNSELVAGMVEMDKLGCIITDENMETSEPGVFAAGDVRAKLLRQVTTAVGDGANAAFAAQRYLEHLKSIQS